MIELDPETQARIAAMGETYRAGLGETLAELDQAVDSVAGGRSAAEREAAVRALSRVAHMLAGTAATFGLGAVGDAAGRLEVAADGMLAAGTIGPDAALDDLRALVADVHAAAETD